jgi:hypothetical protein
MDIRLDVGEHTTSPFYIEPVEIVVTIKRGHAANAICAAGPDTPVELFGREWRTVNTDPGREVVAVTLRAHSSALVEPSSADTSDAGR